MARKRRALRALDYQRAEYWNRLLVQEGLSMRQGEHPHLVYAGGAQDIEALDGALYTDDGRIKPKPQAE